MSGVLVVPESVRQLTTHPDRAISRDARRIVAMFRGLDERLRRWRDAQAEPAGGVR